MKIKNAFSLGCLAFGLVLGGAGCGANRPDATSSGKTGHGAHGVTGGSNDPGVPNVISSGPITYHKQIKPIVDAKCANCHVNGGIGPFPMTSYTEVASHMGDMQAQISNGTMPPWSPDDSCNSYAHDISLTPEQKQAVLDWITAGAPEGNPNDPPDSIATDSGAGTLRVDLELKMPQPYKVQLQPDEYRCFVIPWTETKTKYITGFNIKAGNASIVHHAIVDIIKPSAAAGIKAKDGADGKPGFSCGVAGASINWLGAWAPGSVATIFGAGDEIGTAMAPGSLLVIQMHYHVTGDLAKADPDQSSVQVQMADTVKKEGHMIPFLNASWLGGTSMPIKAGDADAKATYSSGPGLFWTLAGGGSTANLGIYGVGLHMHVRGSRASLNLSQGGQKTCLLNIPKWNFHWQNGYQLKTPLKLAGGTLDMECHWDNSAAGQPVDAQGQKATPRDINWGEGTDSEMCLGIIYMAPF